MTTSLALADDARANVRALTDEASVLSISGLLEPGTYVLLSERSGETEQALLSLDARLRPLGFAEFLPLVGDRIRATRNTVSIAQEVVFAVETIADSYGDFVTLRRSGDSEAARKALMERAESLREVTAALERADARLGFRVELSDRERALLSALVAALRSVATLTATAPTAVEDVYDLLDTVRELQELVERPLDALADTGRATKLVDSLRVTTSDLRGHLSSLDPDRGEVIDLALGSLEVLSTAAEAAGDLLSVAEELETGAFSAAFGEAVGLKLASAEGRLAEAIDLLEALKVEFESGTVAGGFADRIGASSGPEGVFAPAERVIEQTADATQAIASILGYDGPRTYLLLLQNQNEIRATGGFIGAITEFPLDRGVLGTLVFEDSTQVDTVPLINNPPAPEPLYWYLWMGRLLFRDANWNPDFPTSAEVLIDFYESSRATSIDGAIAGTKALSLDLVDALGTVEVPGVEGLLTRERADRLTEGVDPYLCEARHHSDRSKRCFDEDLVPAILDAVRAGLDEDQRTRFIQVVTGQLARKNILIYMEDAEAQRLLLDNGWAGAVGRPAQDMLMVVDSSLPGHTTAAITRMWDYRIRLVPRGRSEAELRIRYKNDRGPEPDCRQALGVGCYWNYLRVFLPSAASNVNGPSAPLHEGTEKLIWGHRELETTRVVVHAGAGLPGLTEVGGYVVVEPGEIATFPVHYELKEGVVRSAGGGQFEYRLQLLKQPGIDNDDVTVAVELPESARLVATSPAGFTQEGRTVQWHGTLSGDTDVVVVFEVQQ